MNDDIDDFEMQYLYDLTLICADCGHIFRKEHQYVCPFCGSRHVSKPKKTLDWNGTDAGSD